MANKAKKARDLLISQAEERKVNENLSNYDLEGISMTD